MNRVLTGMLFLASCAHPASPPTPPSAPAPTPLRGVVASIQTGIGNPKAPDLQVTVSFQNDGAGSCQVTRYALAWGESPGAPRQECTAPVTLGPHATAEGTCLVPDASPMRAAAARTEANLEVVDVVSTCQASR